VDGVRYFMRGRTVVARVGDEDLGHITVPHVSLQWAGGICVPLAGIAGVGTNERFRRRGIAAGMMQEALAFARREGCACSAVSTHADNIARRLYTRAGNVHSFFMRRYTKPLADVAPEPAEHPTEVRPHRPSDCPRVAALIRDATRPFFGAREVMESDRLESSQDKPDQPAPRGFVAERDGNVLGYVGRFRHWSNCAWEIFARGDEVSDAVGAALLDAMEAACASEGLDAVQFWTTDSEKFPTRLLLDRGYAPDISRVFMVNILDLQALLDHLAPLFEQRSRTLDADAVPTELRLSYDDQSAAVSLPGVGPTIEVSASRDAMTRVLCGTLSAWEAYLRNDLDVVTPLEDSSRRALDALLPDTPYHHPVRDWW